MARRAIDGGNKMQLIRKVLLNASLAGMVVLSVATGCGGDDDDDVNTGNGGEDSGGAATAGTNQGAGAGEPSDAGATSGGESSGGAGVSPGGTPNAGAAPAEGGASQAGAGSIFGGAPTSAGAGSGADAAVAKFCNTLGGDATTLRLEIGEGINKLTFTAASGECAPADGQACTEIPSGQAVIVSLYDEANDTLPLHVNPQKIGDGQSWLFFVEKKGANVIWSARTIKGGVACEDVGFSDL
jgi:hypothetical protein